MPQEVIKKNHMDVAWHEYTDENGENVPVVDPSIAEKASVIGRVGIMFLSCGTGAWRVRSSMNTLAEALGITCTADIGLMSIEYTCYDGENGFTQSLCLTNTGVNTLKLNRLEHFIRNFEKEGKHMSGEQLHTFLDNIEKTHGLYSPPALGLAAAIACCGFTFLLGGGPIEMFCAFVGAGIGNYLRCKLTKPILHCSYVLCLLYPWHVLHMQVCSNLEKYYLVFLFSTKRDISVQCSLSYRDFRLLPVVLTLQNWICVQE